MKSCKQSENQSVWDHGISVQNYTNDLLSHLREGKDLEYEWNIPDWVYVYKDLILSNIVDQKTMDLYTLFHDIGKPFCLTIDMDGKRHFPDHAKVSSDIFKKIFPSEKIARELIEHDMDIHLLRPGGILEFSQNPHCVTHLIVGLAEIHSNALMFGGLSSDSFKIKWKRISKNGERILQEIS